jgi:uncharacterized membrane protein
LDRVAESGKAAEKSGAQAKGKGKNMELEIGRYILNRLGILSLVAGIAFFIAYSFKYIGPMAKVGCGFGIAAALILLGKWFESRSKDMKWYGMGLIGGGWGLAYFTTFAMHHIPAVRIIENPNLALIFLVFVTSALMADLLRYRSQVITTLVYVLAFFTASIDKVSVFSLVYSAILSFSLIFVIYRMKWSRLMIFAVLASYLSHIFWLGPEILLSQGLDPKISLEMSRFLLSAGFLTVYWALFTAAPFLVSEENEEDRNNQTAACLLSAFFYGLCMFQEASRIDPSWRFYIALGIGVVSALAAAWAKFGAKREGLVITHVTLAISFITASFPLKFADRWVNIAWLIEIPVLIFLGIYFRRTLYRGVAWILGFVMAAKTIALCSYFVTEREVSVGFGPYLTERCVMLLTAMISFYVCSVIYHMARPQLESSARWEPAIGRWFFVFACFFFFNLSVLDIHENLLSISWGAAALCFFGVGFLSRDKWFRYAAFIFIALIIGRLLLYDMKGLPTIYKIGLFTGLGAALLLISFVYGKVAAAREKEASRE